MAIATATLIAAGVATAATVGSAVAGAVAAGEQQGEAQRTQEANLAFAQETRASASALAQRFGEQAQGFAAQAAADLTPSPTELAAANQQIAVAERAVKRQEELLDSIDPALRAAGDQALALLEGKEAPILKPLQRARQRQRDQLRNRLRETLGPGFEGTTAGQQALQRFDEGTADTLANAQQAATSSLLGVAAAARPDLAQLTSIAGVGAERFASFAERRARGSGLQSAAALNAGQLGVSALTGTPVQQQDISQFAGGAARAVAGGLSSVAGLGAIVATAGIKGKKEIETKTTIDKFAGLGGTGGFGGLA